MNKLIATRADFTELFNNNFNFLVIYLMRYVQNFPVAKDIAQEVFVTVWERRDTIQSPSSFLFVCAKNAALKHLAEKTKSKHISIDEPDLFLNDNEEDLNEYFERLERVSNMIETLPPQCKEVVKKIYFENKKIAETADEMNLSVNTIKTHLKIAKNNLSKLISIMIVITFK